MFSLTPQTKVFVAGHKGLVGSAVVRALKRRGFENIICRDRQQLDLRDSIQVRDFFARVQPEAVILAAAKVGGIGPNSQFPVEFLLENIQIQNNVISSAADHGAQKLVFLGSSCIYPKNATYPLTEDQLLKGPFEPTNEAYGLAKVTGIKLCEYYHRQYGKNFISLQPTNLYGPHDRYDAEWGHVIPAMMVKVRKAQLASQPTVKFWGSGKPLREFLHADDLAEAILLCLEKYHSPELINVGSGEEVSIADLASMVCKSFNYKGQIEWDLSKPDGIFRKPMDSSKLRALGWTPTYRLETGLKEVAQEVRALIG